ncbi:LuxR C-terminal-related transcriptional regulator [Streptomyces sp. NPDC092296]|uniref:helix-turn-helix transcriptional regulator n=1 Tax=Streptomyces sp. NPDC092296 TaxID=3366012 RepID=UPI00380B1E4A
MTNSRLSDAPEVFAALGPDEVQVYAWAVEHGRLAVGPAAAGLDMRPERLLAAVEALARLELLRPARPDEPDGRQRPGRPAPDGEWLAASPVTATAGAALAEARLRRGLADLHRLRDSLTTLGTLYTAAGHDPGAAGRALAEVESLETVLALIEEASERAATEVLTCQPGGGRPAHLLEQASERDLRAVRRGVRMRVLYQHTARSHGPTRAYADRITAAGAEVRTLGELFGQMVAFDRRVVFLPLHRDPEGAVVVRDPSVVGFLCRAFDQVWSLASPFVPDQRRAVVLDDLKRSILRMLAEGLRDETIARRLGMSLRTCRKHIAEMLDQLGAESRFQAGHLAHAAGLLSPDGPPT